MVIVFINRSEMKFFFFPCFLSWYFVLQMKMRKKILEKVCFDIDLLYIFHLIGCLNLKPNLVHQLNSFNFFFILPWFYVLFYFVFVFFIDYNFSICLFQELNIQKVFIFLVYLVFWVFSVCVNEFLLIFFFYGFLNVTKKRSIFSLFLNEIPELNW